MRTVGILNEIKVQRKSTKLNAILYLISGCLWGIVIGFNIVNLFKCPLVMNGIFLEISIIGIIFCIYLFYNCKKKLDILRQKELEITIEKVLIRNYANR